MSSDGKRSGQIAFPPFSNRLSQIRQGKTSEARRKPLVPMDDEGVGLCDMFSHSPNSIVLATNGLEIDS